MLALHSPYSTVFHPWSAALKLILLLGYTTSLFIIKDLYLLGIFALLPLLASASQGWSFFKFMMRLLWPLWPFVAMICLWHSFTWELTSGIKILLRMIAAVWFANLVTVTTPMDSLIKVVFYCLAPLRRFGLRPERIAFAIGLFLRFTPVLIGKGRVLSEAYRARSPKAGTWRIIFPLALVVLDDAEHISEAIRARGGLEEI